MVGQPKQKVRHQPLISVATLPRPTDRQYSSILVVSLADLVMLASDVVAFIRSKISSQLNGIMVGGRVITMPSHAPPSVGDPASLASGVSKPEQTQSKCMGTHIHSCTTIGVHIIDVSMGVSMGVSMELLYLVHVPSDRGTKLQRPFPPLFMWSNQQPHRGVWYLIHSQNAVRFWACKVAQQRF